MKRILFFAVFLPFFLAGCEGTAPENVGETPADPGTGNISELTGTITLYTDNDIIKADGAYAAKLTVLLMDKAGVEHDVTSEVDIYLEGSDSPVESREFRTSDPGVYSFYAVRGFDISNTISVDAASGVEDFPSDSRPDDTSFRHRMLLLQHTGNECPNCPRVMEILRVLSNDEDYNTLYHHVASHSYNTSDAAYSSAAASLSKVLNTTGYYPWLTYNLTTTEGYYLEDIKESIDKLHMDVVDAGISAAVSHSGDKVYANVSIKAGKDARYRVAAWLLEDSIHSVQSGATASWQNMHENCLRSMAGATRTECIYGKSIGELEAGETHDLIVSMDLESGWKVENCKVIIIAVGGDGDDLVNCTVCPVGSKVEYEYN